jgi:multidrug resistance efflux pump
MSRSRLIQFALAAAALIGGATAARGAWSQIKPVTADVPTARVTRGDVATDVHAAGELRTPTTRMITAPAVGGQMRILALKPTGTVVKTGEILLAFDPSDQQYRLEEQESLLKEAELEIEKLNADAAAQAAKDRVDLLTAQFDVKKAQLDVSGNELLGAIDARKRELTLEEARRRLAQLQDDVTSHAKTNEAGMAVLAEKRNKARLTMGDAQKTIEQMTVRAPIDGVVSVQSNMEGNFYFTGMALPEYHEGDSVSSGRSVVEVLDVGRMELVVRVPETDSARIAPGQRAAVTLDTGTLDIGGPERASAAASANAKAKAPAATASASASVPAGAAAATPAIDATVTAIGGIRAGGNGWGRQPEGPVRKIDVTLRLDQPLVSARPGLTAQILLKSDPLKGVLAVPRQAVFDRDGKPHVYLKKDDRFTLTPIKITARTETAVVVQDLAEGAEVALADPEIKPGQTTPSGPAAPATPARVAASR